MRPRNSEEVNTNGKANVSRTTYPTMGLVPRRGVGLTLAFLLTVLLTGGCDGVLLGPEAQSATVTDEEAAARISELNRIAKNGPAYCAKMCNATDSCGTFCLGHDQCTNMCEIICNELCSDVADGGSLSPDAGMPVPDQGMPSPDQGVPSPDQGVPSPDQGSGGVPPTGGTVYYVRPGGGSTTQCTGTKNADYPGSGTGRACAWKHPFYALPPGGSPRIKGGDTLLIASGSYRMGHGAPGASDCSSSWPWDCYAPSIPSGTKSAPTRIFGEGWDTGCKSAPELYGAERARRVLQLDGSDHVVIQCLEITDRSSCVESHSGGLACNRSSYPYGNWAGTGLYAEDAENVTLKQVNIHGMAHTGIHAGRLKDWTLEDVKIVANGWVGWDGDLASGGSSSNTGEMMFRRVEISWNGCGETYPGEKPTGCWAQTAGGYGDGMGTAATGGNWTFEDCRVMHNTSDGIDLLYHTLGGKVTVRRMRAEGNAGNQLKVAGEAHVENSLLVGNCAYFQGKSFTHHVDACRAMGNTLSISYTGGETVTVVNNTLYGEGDVLMIAGERDSGCSGGEKLIAVNNIFLGDTEYHASYDKAAAFYNDGCSSLTFQEEYGLIYNVKNGCPKLGQNDLCADPKLGPLSGDLYGMMPGSGSPAIDSGRACDSLVPTHDYLKVARPTGSGVDRGACEVKP